MFKKKNSMAIVIGLLLLVVLFACGRKGSLTPNNPPEISITSYAGDETFNVETESIIFQQTIYWSAHDVEGGIDGYAFRVLEYDASAPNGEGAPISTPGWDAIDDNGWVYHYKPGVDTSGNTPDLSSPEAANIRQIWSQLVFARINFPANGEPYTDAEGNIVHEPIPSIFQVKCIDEQGEESNIASRIFYAESATPSVNLVTAIDGQVIGKGTVFEFAIFDEDDDLPGIDGLAKEFQFAFLKGSKTTVDGVNYFTPSADDYNMVELDSNGVPVNHNNWNWISTKDEDDVGVFRFPSKNPLYSDIELKSNIPDELDPLVENANDNTYMFFRAIDLSNIISDVEYRTFYVYGNFSPQTLLFLVDSFILGQNHYQPEYEPGLGKVIPIQQTASGVNYSKRFWKNLQGEYEVIGSNDIKFYFHWGWKGEFEQNDPWGQQEGTVKDRYSNINYNSEIVYFDLRLNGEALFYPPVPADGENLHVDEDGKQWLRVSRFDSIFNKITVTRPALIHSGNDLYGSHVFEIRAVDLQGVVDREPYTLNFNIVPKVEAADKNGVLIVNDVASNLSLVESKYHEVMTHIGVDSAMVNYRSLTNSGLHFGRDLLSPTDMQNYKLVIYNQDVEPHLNANFHNEFATLFLYLQTGGNLVLSGGKNLQYSHVESYNAGLYPNTDFFGIGNYEEDVTFFGANFLQQPYFISAMPDNGFTTQLDVQLPPDFSTAFINLTQAIGPIAKFNEFTSTVIYRYGAKAPGTDNYSPTQEWYDEFNGFPVALKNIRTNGSKCYVFGFPLMYMELDDVKSLYQEIWNDLD